MARWFTRLVLPSYSHAIAPSLLTRTPLLAQNLSHRNRTWRLDLELLTGIPSSCEMSKTARDSLFSSSRSGVVNKTRTDLHLLECESVPGAICLIDPLHRWFFPWSAACRSLLTHGSRFNTLRNNLLIQQCPLYTLLNFNKMALTLRPWTTAGVFASLLCNACQSLI